jgi:hypothetical protein
MPKLTKSEFECKQRKNTNQHNDNDDDSINNIQHTPKMNSTSTDNNINVPDSTFHLLNVPTKLNNVDSLIRVSHHNKPATMPDGYIPSDSDVCCGRGKQNWNMPGNVNFRKLIRASVARYMAASLRNEKTAVVVSVFDEIRRQGVRFLKQQEQHGSRGCWYDIGDAAAREKVGHSLRDHAAKSPLQLAKEQTRRDASAATSDCDSVESAAEILTQTETLSSLLSSLSPSPSTDETTLSQGPLSVPTDISSEMLGTDLLPMNSSPLLLSNVLDCFDISNLVDMR